MGTVEVEFKSYEDLKLFLENILDFLQNRTFRLNKRSFSLKEFNDRIEQHILTIIYSSYCPFYFDIVKHIAGIFFRILQTLIPSENFRNIFRRLIYFECMEHRIKFDSNNKLYRDHILHCANVCWIGEKLIFTLSDGFYEHIKNVLISILPSGCKNFLVNEDCWEEFIRTTWYITAIVHDFGYPIELIEEKILSEDIYLASKNYINPCKLKDYFVTYLSPGFIFIKKLIKRINKEILSDPFHESEKIHPVIGSLELLHFFKSNFSNCICNKKIFRYIYQLSALAILEHHKEKDKKINFFKNPFGYVLALADLMHEWHRYIYVGIDSAGKDIFVSPIKRVELEKITDRKYNINFYRHPDHFKCPDWKSTIFEAEKRKELDLIEKDSDLPQFELELK